MFIIAVYLFGMLRKDGVDIDNYLMAYYDDVTHIPDVGFQYLMLVFKTMHLPFEAMMLCIACINLYALRRVSTYYSVSFGLVLVIWFLHIAVVRDFAQLRSSVAISVALIGVTSRHGGVRWALYACAFSFHFTATIFIFCFELCSRITRIRGTFLRTAAIAGVSFSILALGYMLPFLGFLDERVEIYLSWQKEGYGAKVSSFGSLLLNFVILAAAICYRRQWQSNEKLRVLFYMQLLGVAVFVGFAGFAIFAFRLSAMVLALYPVLIASVIQMSIGLDREGGRAIKALEKGTILLCFAAMLLLRPNTLFILNLVEH
ncbi:MAG: EpsG family protein [Agarilytica sp.]